MTLELRYDADSEPVEGWLELDEQQRQDAIVRYHERLKVEHPELPNIVLHASIHLVLENQLAMGNPAEARLALERLRSRGLTRHEALHRLGVPLSDCLFALMQGEAERVTGLREYEQALRAV